MVSTQLYLGSKMISCMPRPKQDTKARTIRFLAEVAKAVDRYAEDEMISANLAVNKLLLAKLIEIGYIKSGSTANENGEEE